MCLVLSLVFLILIDLAFNTFSLFVGEEGGLENFLEMVRLRQQISVSKNKRNTSKPTGISLFYTAGG